MLLSTSNRRPGSRLLKPSPPPTTSVAPLPDAAAVDAAVGAGVAAPPVAGVAGRVAGAVGWAAAAVGATVGATGACVVGVAAAPPQAASRPPAAETPTPVQSRRKKARRLTDGARWSWAR